MAAVDPSVFEALYGLSSPAGRGGQPGQQPRGPAYLGTQRRSATSRIALNTGTFYLIGAGAGGLFGAVQGLRAAESKILKIRLNGMMNGVEGGVARSGNALGVLALTYSIVDALGEWAGLAARIPGDYADDIAPVLSAATTGLLYKCTSSPKQAIIAAGIGGGLMGAYKAAMAVLPADAVRSLRRAGF
jgi:hypothetical protein